MKGKIIESKITEVYIIILEELDVVKVGITNNFPERMYSLKNAMLKSSLIDITITPVHRFVVKSRLSAVSLEKSLHKKFKDYQIYNYDFAGHTELFSKEILNKIPELIDIPKICYYNPDIYCEPSEYQIGKERDIALIGRSRGSVGVRGIKWLTGNILANYILMCKSGVDELYYSKIFLNKYFEKNAIRKMEIFRKDFTLSNLNCIFHDSLDLNAPIIRLPEYITPSKKAKRSLFKEYPIWEYRLSCCIGCEIL